jgi:hypothetical protein
MPTGGSCLASLIAGQIHLLLTAEEDATKDLFEGFLYSSLESLPVVIDFIPAESLSDMDRNLVGLNKDLGNTGQLHQFAHKLCAVMADLLQVFIARGAQGAIEVLNHRLRNFKVRVELPTLAG